MRPENEFNLVPSIPPLREMLTKFKRLRLSECYCCDGLNRNIPGNLRDIIDNQILNFCTANRLQEITLMSIASGRLMQETTIAYKLANAGIQVNFIIIDPDYSQLNTISCKCGFITLEANEDLRTTLIQFKDVLAMLHCKLLGIFSSMDSYLAAYTHSPAPRYVLSNEQPRTRYTIRYEHEFTKRKAQRNLIWTSEVYHFTSTCFARKPDLIIAVDPALSNDTGVTTFDHPSNTNLYLERSTMDEDEFYEDVHHKLWMKLLELEHISRLRAVFGVQLPIFKMFQASNQVGRVTEINGNEYSHETVRLDLVKQSRKRPISRS